MWINLGQQNSVSILRSGSALNVITTTPSPPSTNLPTQNQYHRVTVWVSKYLRKSLLIINPRFLEPQTQQFSQFTDSV